jgi:hypothetical protein
VDRAGATQVQPYHSLCTSASSKTKTVICRVHLHISAAKKVRHQLGVALPIRAPESALQPYSIKYCMHGAICPTPLRSSTLHIAAFGICQ